MLSVLPTAEEAGDATHMLLYLNADTWSDERLAEQVHRHRRVGQMPQLGAFVGDDFVENVHPRSAARPRYLSGLTRMLR